jgi:hypothetical protein
MDMEGIDGVEDRESQPSGKSGTKVLRLAKETPLRRLK